MTITLHWPDLILAALIIFWIIMLGKIIGSGGGDYDFGTPLIALTWILLGMVVLTLYGGVFWW